MDEDAIAKAIETLAQYLGGSYPVTTTGALEALGIQINEGCARIADAIEKLAEAIENLNPATEE